MKIITMSFIAWELYNFTFFSFPSNSDMQILQSYTSFLGKLLSVVSKKQALFLTNPSYSYYNFSYETYFLSSYTTIKATKIGEIII